MNNKCIEYQDSLCTSVFISENLSDRKKLMTLRWIEAINRSEKDNSFNFADYRNDKSYLL